ncbi:MAG: hypothetical protein AAGN66_20340 [Acidobacteriota bacterium]
MHPRFGLRPPSSGPSPRPFPRPSSRALALCVPLLALLAAAPAPAATPGTVSVIDYEESSTSAVLNPMAVPTSAWACSPYMQSNGRCFTNSGTGDSYVLNGAIAVDPKLPDGLIYYYVHLWTKGNSGPAHQFDDASFVVMTAPRTWGGMRGAGITLERDDIRPEDFREWTMHHAIYDPVPGKFFVNTTTPQNGSNDSVTGYVDGFVVIGVSSDGITNFDWRHVLKFQRVHNYRMLGMFFEPDAGTCTGSNCQYSGVLTWLKHLQPTGNGQFGTTPIRYRPCFGVCADQGEIDIRIEGQGWRTFTIPAGNSGVDLGAQGLAPERTLDGRTMGYTKATFGGVTQYELWRNVKGVTHGVNPWAPCAVTDPTFAANRTAWPAGRGAKLQYRRYDPASGTAVDSTWIDFTSPHRDIAPAHYNMWATWIIGRLDYGQQNLLYVSNRDRHICIDGNAWDLGTGKNIEWIQLGESLGTNQ